MFKSAHRVARPYMKALQSGYRVVRRSIRDDSPPWFGHSLDWFLDHLDLVMVDHGCFRAAYPNRWRIARGVWRSSQPAPSQIAWAARRGIRTVINLRGARNCGSYRLEVAACRHYGVALVDFPARSREAPPAHFFHDAKALFASIEYPMLMHCKSGADRVGLMSVLYLVLAEGRPVEEARRQLSLRFGHFAAADTGILDAVFDAYLEQTRAAPITFLEWIDTRYDPKAITAAFKNRPHSANVLVNGILRRE